jgi:ABC-type nitrate/sulfonate/bicarbonate transport system substrate-binding protein
MPSEVYKKFYKDLDKAAKEAEEKQKKFREAEIKAAENYQRERQKEIDAEKYARLFPEDSTREYNPVEHYKDGGLVGRGQGRTIKTKKTKIY